MAVTGLLTRVMMLDDPDGDWLRMSLEIDFAPASIEAHGVLTNVTNHDEGFAVIELTKFRTRRPDGQTRHTPSRTTTLTARRCSQTSALA
jgi:hypothetical protein